MEVAAYLADKAKSVTCVDVCDIPFARILGNRVGLAIQKVCCVRGKVLTKGVSLIYKHLSGSCCCLVRCMKRKV